MITQYNEGERPQAFNNIRDGNICSACVYEMTRVEKEYRSLHLSHLISREKERKEVHTGKERTQREGFSAYWGRIGCESILPTGDYCRRQALESLERVDSSLHHSLSLSLPSVSCLFLSRQLCSFHQEWRRQIGRRSTSEQP